MTDEVPKWSSKLNFGVGQLRHVARPIVLVALRVGPHVVRIGRAGGALFAPEVGVARGVALTARSGEQALERVVGEGPVQRVHTQRASIDAAVRYPFLDLNDVPTQVVFISAVLFGGAALWLVLVVVHFILLGTDT